MTGASTNSFIGESRGNQLMLDRSGWTLTVVPSHEALSRAAADVVAATVRRSPDAVIAVSNGNTPLACCT